LLTFGNVSGILQLKPASEQKKNFRAEPEKLEGATAMANLH